MILTPARKNRFVSRLCAGYAKYRVRGVEYKVALPTYSLLYDAEEECVQLRHKCRFDDMLNDQRVVSVLISTGQWVPQGDYNLQELHKNIENYKIRAYTTLLGAKIEHEKILKLLKLSKARASEQERIRHSLDGYTLDGLMSWWKQRYVLYHSSTPKPDGFALAALFDSMIADALNVEQYREVARTEPWRSLWSIKKNDIFDELCDERRTLVLFSRMYDGAYENSDCPPDDVIENDDLFDGWLLKQKREHDREKLDRRLEKDGLTSKHPNAGEIFIPAATQDEANRIMGRNTIQNRAAIQTRQRMIQHAGTDGVTDNKMPDVQRRLQQESNKMFKERK